MLSNVTPELAFRPGQPMDHKSVTRANRAVTDSLRASRLR
jgi:hypothetical protein